MRSRLAKRTGQGKAPAASGLRRIAGYGQAEIEGFFFPLGAEPSADAISDFGGVMASYAALVRVVNLASLGHVDDAGERGQGARTRPRSDITPTVKFLRNVNLFLRLRSKTRARLDLPSGKKIKFVCL
jgi:hypothetical protein